ncbi:hypothetical protein [Occultella gossypii]|uniref:DUF7847 domain-containing protein n=1 Tax=Occultella gossypii TaxID=2800820 RepID=A0ABS7S9F5_9MICO|nr:hypothetical protein [Occultella gossypii]MBZ2196390.1 hypothetical protein [Occultella gossypii]
MTERGEPTPPRPDPNGTGPTGWGDVSPGGYGTTPGQPGEYDQGQPGGYPQGQPGGYPQGQQQPPHQPGQYGTPPPGPAGPPPSGSYGQYGPVDPSANMTPLGPAPQPGIIPLRPLTLGEIYDGAFRSIRANPTVMFVLAAIVVAVLGVIQAIATWGTFEQLNETLRNFDPMVSDSEALDNITATLQSQLLATGVSGLLSFVVSTILTGVLIHSVSQSVIGRKMSLADVWQAVKPQIGRLLLLTLVILLLVALVTFVFVGIIVLAAASGSLSVIAIAGILGVLGLLAALAFVITVTVLATPVLVLERSGVLAALKRSWKLTLPTFWRVFGIYLLTTILIGILAQVITYPLQLIGQAIGGFGTLTTILTLAGGVIASALTTPFLAAVVALLYIDIRIRTEALDVDLAAAAEAP